jgi:hypothetical protein
LAYGRLDESEAVHISREGLGVTIFSKLHMAMHSMVGVAIMGSISNG